MKQIHFLLGLVLLTAANVACNSDNDNPTPQKAGQLPAPAHLRGGAERGTGLTFSWDAVPDTGGYAYIFDGGEERQTKLTSVSFDNLEPEREYAFKVRAISDDTERYLDSEWAETTATTGTAPAPVQPFTLTVEEVTFYSARVKVIPDNPQTSYFCNLIDRASFERYASPEALIEAQIARIETAAAANDLNFEAFCIATSLLNTGEGEFITQEILEADTEYIQYVFGLDYSGKATTGLASVGFRTEKAPTIQPSSMTFTLEVSDISDIGGKLHVTPSTGDEYYYSFFVLKENLDLMGDEYVIQACLNDLNGHIASSDYATIVAEQCYKGEHTISYGEFDPNMEYVGFAFGIGQHGLLAAASTGLFVSEPFMTQDAEGSDAPIRIEVIEFGIENVQIKFIPSSGAVPYRCELVKLSDFDGMSDEEILAADMERLWSDYADYYVLMLLYEDFTMKRINPLAPDTDYIAYAYGLSDSEMEATTTLCKKILRTPPAAKAGTRARTLLRR